MKGRMKFSKSKLKELRINAGYSRSEFAQALCRYQPKASRQIVENWEEKGAQPTASYLLAISKVLGSSAEDFFTKSR